MKIGYNLKFVMTSSTIPFYEPFFRLKTPIAFSLLFLRFSGIMNDGDVLALVVAVFLNLDTDSVSSVCQYSGIVDD